MQKASTVKNPWFKKLLGPSARRALAYWDSFLSEADGRFPGVSKEVMPEGYMGYAIIDYWLKGVFDGRPIYLRLGPPSPWSSVWAIRVSGLFRGAPPGMEGAQPMPLFFLAAPLNRLRQRVFWAPGGFAMWFYLAKVFRVLDLPFPPPVQKIDGLTHPFHLYASDARMRASLVSQTWTVPLRNAESLLDWTSSGHTSRCLMVAGIGDTVTISVPLVTSRTPAYYVDLVEQLLRATTTIETSHEGPSLTQIPLLFEEKCNMFYSKVRCGTCGKMENIVPAYDSETGVVVNMMTEKCEHIVFARTDKAGKLTSIDKTPII